MGFKKGLVYGFVISFCISSFQSNFLTQREYTKVLMEDNSIMDDTYNSETTTEDSRKEENTVHSETTMEDISNEDATYHGDILDELDRLSRGSNYTEESQNCPSPKRFYHNRIVRSNEKEARFIPKIMHLSFKERCLPQDMYRNFERWEKMFPNYSIFLHDDEAVERLFHKETYPEFPGFHRALKCVLYKGAMSIDIWRVLILWLYGGVYTDTDVYATDKFNKGIIPDDTTAFFQ